MAMLYQVFSPGAGGSDDEREARRWLSPKYRIVRALARGGLSEVYEVEHVELRRRCAAKLLRPEFANDAELRERLLREGRALAALRHPNLLDVMDVDQHPELGPYLVVELLSGKSLEERIWKGGKLPPKIAASICDQLLAALEAAHEIRVIHRDVKPANVIVDGPTGRPRVKLIDFGVARPEMEEKLTRPGMIIGTPLYMAPEQLDGSSPIDARIDLYGAGCTLYMMLAGKQPFDGVRTDRLRGAKERGEFRPVTQHSPEVTAALAELTAKAMAARPSDRYQTAREMRQALRVAAPHLAALTMPPIDPSKPNPLDVTNPVSSARRDPDGPTDRDGNEPAAANRTQQTAPARPSAKRAPPPLEARESAAPAPFDETRPIVATPTLPSARSQGSTVAPPPPRSLLRAAWSRINGSSLGRIGAAALLALPALVGARVLLRRPSLAAVPSSAGTPRPLADPPPAAAAALPAPELPPAKQPPLAPPPAARALDPPAPQPDPPMVVVHIVAPPGAKLLLDGRPLDGQSASWPREGLTHKLEVLEPRAPPQVRLLADDGPSEIVVRPRRRPPPVHRKMFLGDDL